MKGWRLTLLAAAAVLGLQACDQSAPTTNVEPPRASLPDDAALRGPDSTTLPQQAPTAPPADSLGTSQAVSPPPAEGSTPPQVAGTPPPDGNTPPQVAGTPPTSADGTQGPTSTMGAPAAPNAALPAGALPPQAAGGQAPGAQAPGAQAPGGQGTAAMTEMWQAFPPGGAAASTSSQAGGAAGTPASTPARVSSADLPAVRNPGDPQGAQLLAQRPLEVPVAGVVPTALADQYEQGRGSRRHEAIDILAPAGTPVVAVDDGRIAKLFTSKPGGLTIYQFDPHGKLAYYYAHLQGYAQGVREGKDVRRGELLGYVGSTGNADVKAPHLHFAVFRLGTPAKWWEGKPVNPYPALSRAAPAQQFASR
jgi:murein DD-endopeptidase MepM/ murein hydrolase activator NlpD